MRARNCLTEDLPDELIGRGIVLCRQRDHAAKSNDAHEGRGDHTLFATARHFALPS